MNTFNTMDELEDYILERVKQAMIPIQEQVYAIVDRFLKQYYAEYTPSYYERTYQLYKSLVKTGIKKTANGYEAYVYFDVDTLDYAFKTFKKRARRTPSGEYMNPFNRQVNSSGVFKNEGYSAEKTLAGAMFGSHGGLSANGTYIWIESLRRLDNEYIDIFKKYLKANGIPIK